MAPLLQFAPDERSPHPIYKQIADRLASLIENGDIQTGERLPATRELAGHLGLNRATISAAYALLEETGFLAGHVGRGSFVVRRERPSPPPPAKREWGEFFSAARHRHAPSSRPVRINFASSRPDQSSFPLATFRKLAKEVIEGSEISEILQLGSPYGYGALRRFLLEEATAEGIARSSDGVLMTNGCQQALDLVARVLASGASSSMPVGVVVEDPSYHGLLRVFSRPGLSLLPVPVGEDGLALDALETTLVRHRPRALIVTPSFHNPTGVTLALPARKRILELASAHNVILIENDIYSQLRYTGEPLPTLKELDDTGNTILLRSYSKVAFPGLRVGWVLAPREVLTRLADEKQIADLHSDQLSQAVLLRFAESGEFAQHLDRTCIAGRQRLQTALASAQRFLPPGARWTRPEGGMSFWVELPAPLVAEQVLARAQKSSVDFLAGRHFASRPAHERALRISFGGLAPDSIEEGLRILGEAAAAEWNEYRERQYAEPAVALV